MPSPSSVWLCCFFLQLTPIPPTVIQWYPFPQSNLLRGITAVMSAETLVPAL